MSTDAAERYRRSAETMARVFHGAYRPAGAALPVPWESAAPEHRDALTDALAAVLATQDNAICWDTTCLSCAAVLDSGVRETFRAERAEAALARVRALAEAHEACDSCGLGGVDPDAIRAAPGEPVPTGPDGWEDPASGDVPCVGLVCDDTSSNKGESR